MINILSFGGGVDSSAILELELSRQHNFGIDHVIFADTGAESPSTYKNVSYYKRRCQQASIPFHVVRQNRETITQWVLRLGIIPLMPGGSHVCSKKFKSDVIQKFVKQTFGDQPINYLIGIEYNEQRRVKRFTKPASDNATYSYPLIDLKLDREACEKIILNTGRYIAKSSCFFCPFMKEHEIKAAYNNKTIWDKITTIEDAFRKTSPQKHQAWLDAGRPLNSAGKCKTGHWRVDSWSKGARLFATRIDGKQLSIQDWENRFREQSR